MEDTSWGKVLLMIACMAGMLALIFRQWHLATEAFDEADDTWTIVFLALAVSVFLIEIFYLIRGMFKLARRFHKPPVPNEPAPLPGEP